MKMYCKKCRKMSQIPRGNGVEVSKCPFCGANNFVIFGDDNKASVTINGADNVTYYEHVNTLNFS